MKYLNQGEVYESRIIDAHGGACPVRFHRAAADKHEESKPRHGGVVTEVNEVDYELVARGGNLVIHVSDHGKPVSTKGWSGKIATVGGDKASAELAPSGENLMQSKGPLQVKPGSRLLATIQAPGKKPIQVRFTAK